MCLEPGLIESVDLLLGFVDRVREVFLALEVESNCFDHLQESDTVGAFGYFAVSLVCLNLLSQDVGAFLSPD